MSAFGNNTRSRFSTYAIAAIAVFVGACGGDLDPASRLVTFRTVAMRATRVVQSATCDAGLVATADARPDRPEKLGKTNCEVSGSYAHPGDEVQLELLWHDPDAAAKHDWMWTTCLNPPSSSVLGCFQKIGQDVAKVPAAERVKFLDANLRQRVNANALAFETNELADPETKKTDTRTLFRINVPADALKPYEGGPAQARAGATLGVVFVACPGKLVLNFEALAARRNELPLKCIDADGVELGSDKFTIGIKRLFLREREDNQDPPITGVTWDGTPWEAGDVKELTAACDPTEARFDRCGQERHAIAPQIGEGFAQSGIDELGTNFTEQVVVQYYATEGLFEFDVKRAEVPSTNFAGRRTKTGPQTMWIVVRDSRGGVRWLERSFIVR